MLFLCLLREASLGVLKIFGLQNMVFKVGSSRGWRQKKGADSAGLFEGKSLGTNGSFLPRAE